MKKINRMVLNASSNMVIINYKYKVTESICSYYAFNASIILRQTELALHYFKKYFLKIATVHTETTFSCHYSIKDASLTTEQLST